VSLDRIAVGLIGAVIEVEIVAAIGGETAGAAGDVVGAVGGGRRDYPNRNFSLLAPKARRLRKKRNPR